MDIEWEHWWWDWAGDPAIRPTLEVQSRPREGRLKPGQYVHRFGIQSRPARVPPKPHIRAKGPRG